MRLVFRRERVSLLLSSISPPGTGICPSSTTTVDSMERLLVDGPALVVPAAVVQSPA